ncbi:MAG: FtsX-like permease family protein [Deltaproteobacteria bacterium]|nr:FtsX-like permease family protein [Deltaproteobacteria bacterium]
MILLRIALRNIAATKVRTLIIGLLITFGTMLVVVGGSLLSTLDRSMARSIIGSVSSHLQLCDEGAKDALEFFSPPTGTPDLGQIRDFPKVKAALEALPEVEAVVPMGSDFAMVFSGNVMDVKIAELSAAVKRGDREKAQVLADHVHKNVVLLQESLRGLEGFVNLDDNKEERQVDLGNLATAASDEFWADFLDSPEEKLVFLENKVARLAMDAKMLFLRYLGTDTEAFRKNFDLFEVVKGEMIPPGRRGFLFSEFIYERQVKNQVAMRLDFIKENLEAGRTIKDDPKVASRVQQNVRQYKEILYQMDRQQTAQLVARLQELLEVEEKEPEKLLEQFLEMDDENFAVRYRFFYDEIAPAIVLYQVRIGDILTIRSYTRSGYATAVNVPVYGTFRFKGMEKSALAGVYNLMDLMTYRDLYGYMSPARKAEIASLKAETGVEEIDRASAEDALFGGDDGEAGGEDGGTRPSPGEGGPPPAADASSDGGFDEFAGIDMEEGGQRYGEALLRKVYPQEEIDTGVVTNAAVRLAAGVDLEVGRAAVEKAVREGGFGLSVIDWRQASGLVGQFLGVVWIVLFSAILIIFLVALVIINNSMVMATLDRTREIGTMRAIGAQRSYVLKMFLIESTVLGVGFGLLGTLLGSMLIVFLGRVGIPAVSDELYFLFAGSHLYPVLLPGHLVSAFVVVFLVSLASTLYPARLAARIQPVKAMGKED